MLINDCRVTLNSEQDCLNSEEVLIYNENIFIESGGFLRSYFSSISVQTIICKKPLSEMSIVFSPFLQRDQRDGWAQVGTFILILSMMYHFQMIITLQA